MRRSGHALLVLFGTLLGVGVILGPLGGLIGGTVGCRGGGDMCGLAGGAGLLAGLGVAVVAALVAAIVSWSRWEGSTEIPPSPTPRAWLVAEPGIDLADDPDSCRTVAHLAAGVRVFEYHRFGDHLLVSTRDGLTGWVAADRLEPTGEVEGGPGG